MNDEDELRELDETLEILTNRGMSIDDIIEALANTPLEQEEIPERLH